MNETGQEHEKALETRALCKSYGRARGIVDVDLSVNQGEVFGFIGPNGAGKSTTIRTLLGLIRPTSGSASIFGRDCLKSGRSIRFDIGYIPSEVNYYDDMRVSSLLRYSARLYRKECGPRTRELCSSLGVETEKRISSLSSGNKKKVAIVQALQHEPRLLILDEPTNGLDPLVQNTLYEILREEHSKGVTLFLSSHVLSEVQRLCDRVAIIKEGRILGVETVDAMRRSLYKRVKVEFTSDAEAEVFSDEIAATAAMKPDPDGIIRMDGASAIERKERTLTFLYRGDLKPIVRRISSGSFENLWMEEPSLEEVFLHYYENGRGTT